MSQAVTFILPPPSSSKIKISQQEPPSFTYITTKVSVCAKCLPSDKEGKRQSCRIGSKESHLRPTITRNDRQALSCSSGHFSISCTVLLASVCLPVFTQVWKEEEDIWKAHKSALSGPPSRRVKNQVPVYRDSRCHTLAKSTYSRSKAFPTAINAKARTHRTSNLFYWGNCSAIKKNKGSHELGLLCLRVRLDRAGLWSRNGP